MTNRTEISERVKLLIIDYLQGTAANDDVQSIKRWINENRENRELFYKIKASWELSEGISNKSRFDNETLWNQLQLKLNKEVYQDKHPEKMFSDTGRILRIAASWLLLFIAGSAVTYLITKKDTELPTSKTAILSPLGSKSQVILPDGTSVWLNAGSKLEYNADFNTTYREVHLTGEGFFDVTTNPGKPFVVMAGNIAIKAIGTSFNVKAYPEEKKVITTLVKGKVSIEGKDEQMKPFTITLQPKQNVTYFTDSRLIASIQDEITGSKNIRKDFKTAAPQILPSIPVIKDQEVKTELFTSWKDSRWIIEGEKLGNLSVMLERRFNVVIYIDSEELKNYRFSGTIENETLEQVFQILRLTLPINYMIDTGKVSVKIDKKLKEKYRSAYKN